MWWDICEQATSLTSGRIITFELKQKNFRQYLRQFEMQLLSILRLGLFCVGCVDPNSGGVGQIKS